MKKIKKTVDIYDFIKAVCLASKNNENLSNCANELGITQSAVRSRINKLINLGLNVPKLKNKKSINESVEKYFDYLKSRSCVPFTPKINSRSKYEKLLKGELDEKQIARSANFSYVYAKDILKGRFLLGEKAISKNPEIMLAYAQYVIKGQLPEEMHNIMVCYAISK